MSARRARPAARAACRNGGNNDSLRRNRVEMSAWRGLVDIGVASYKAAAEINMRREGEKRSSAG